MKLTRVAVCLSLGWCVAGEVIWRVDRQLVPRQDSEAPLPTLGQSTAPASSAQPSNTNSGQRSTITNQPASSAPASSSIIGSSNSTQTTSSTLTDAISSTVSSLNPTTTSDPSSTNGTNSDANQTNNQLPLQPDITPALSIAGVLLILTGVVYSLIGLKNQWVHVFLSTAFLTSLATLVLIIYVINPPVSNAVQGAYFVGVFLSGVILGGGALVFKEVTEGLGCLLGGYCLAMWFLTLKEGGLITNSAGKGIFIGVWCIVCWSLSFSHYTRSYALIGSTSFSGATAFVLGIDCFSKGGLKEFWVYVWDLNDKLFPLYTETYPITRGTRVETIVIILGTIIGVISQIKLWKLVRDKQKAREAAVADDERRRDAVEEALGRHLERQNDKDRAEWEKRYGNRLDAKRQTILWTEAHGETKRFSGGSTTEVGSANNSDSSESVEMSTFQHPPAVAKAPVYKSMTKRQSNMTVQPIQEVDEDEDAIRPVSNKSAYRKSFLVDGGDLMPTISVERLDIDDFSSFRSSQNEKALANLESKSSPRLDPMQSLKPSSNKPGSKKIATRLRESEADTKTKKHMSMPTFKELKRRSLQSLTSKSPPIPSAEQSPQPEQFGESQEALVRAESLRTASRASSLAATMDGENENFDALGLVDSHQPSHRPPEIVLSPVHAMSFTEQLKSGLPPSPGALSDTFDQDPEELVRRPNTYSAFDDGTVRAAPASADPNASVASETLTRDALTRVPSQLSNVVMSYRTNEWAKHIAAAEAPMYEEPEPILHEEEEAPTHLASPISPAPAPEVESTPKPPPLPSPITSVAPSESGVKVNPEAQPQTQSRPVSEQQEEPVATIQPVSDTPTRIPIQHVPNTSTMLPARSASQVSTIPPKFPPPSHPVRSLSQTSGMPRSFTDPNLPYQPQRSTSRLSFSQTPTIDENAATHSRRISASTNGYQPYMPSQRSSSAQGQYSRSPSAQGLYSRSQNDLAHSLSQPLIATAGRSYQDLSLASGPLINSVNAVRSETRLRDASQSHQPLKRNNTNEGQRQDLMANWRTQLAQSHSQVVVPQVGVETRYVQHMMDFEADKQRREAERMSKAQSQAFMDQSMRTQGMIDAHREVLKKMQSQANRKLTK